MSERIFRMGRVDEADALSWWASHDNFEGKESLNPGVTFIVNGNRVHATSIQHVASANVIKVTWSDGVVTTTRPTNGDPFSLEGGVALAVLKRVLGGYTTLEKAFLNRVVDVEKEAEEERLRKERVKKEIKAAREAVYAARREAEEKLAEKNAAAEEKVINLTAIAFAKSEGLLTRLYENNLDVTKMSIGELLAILEESNEELE